MQEDIRFLADGMLGRCAKWLRFLGYDTVYFTLRDKFFLAYQAINPDVEGAIARLRENDPEQDFFVHAGIRECQGEQPDRGYGDAGTAAAGTSDDGGDAGTAERANPYGGEDAGIDPDSLAWQQCDAERSAVEAEAAHNMAEAERVAQEEADRLRRTIQLTIIELRLKYLETRDVNLLRQLNAYGDYIDIERWRRGKADMEALMAQCLVEQVIMRGLSEESLAEMDRLVTGLYVQRVISPEGETHYSSLYPLHNDEVIAGLSAAPAGTAAH